MAGEAILVVDDNPTNSKLAKVLLVAEGYAVETAADAEEAIATLETFRPDLILMDIQLPGLDGLSLTRRLKNDPETREIVVIALTSYAMKGDEERARNAGCDGYVSKPIDTRTLPVVIAEHLAQAAARRVSSPSRATILVVEDNPLTRKMLRAALETEGYFVLDVADGATALAAAATRRPDLVVLDYSLPDTDGLTLLAELRQTLARSELPALLVTGMASRRAELALRAGAFALVLTKPVEPSVLLEVVRAHLGPAVVATRGLVLVIDDEPLNRKLAALRVGQAGFEVVTAEGVESGLAAARARCPDAILADVLMPGKDGFALCTEVRGDAQLAAVPLILTSTAYGDAADQDLARRLGADALVPRTPDLAEAISAIEQSLARRQSALAVPNSDQLELAKLHRERIQAQLERQAERSDLLTRQSAIQATALSVIRGLSETLTAPRDAARVISDVLVHCLDATGLSTGLLYLTTPGRPPYLEAQFGIPPETVGEAEACFGCHEALAWVVAGGQPIAVARDSNDEVGLAALLNRLGYGKALFVPFVVLGQSFGVLILASDTHDLLEPAWLGFGRSLSSQFGQTVALGQSLGRLAASEARYRALMEQANDAILIADLEHRIVEANRQAELALGRSRGELLGRRYEELVVSDELHAAAEGWEGLLTEGSRRVERRHLLHTNGSKIPVEISASLVRVGEANEPFVLAIGRDISDRLAAEQQLRDAQLRLEHVVASSPALLFTLRLEGGRLVATWFSGNIERLLGFTAEEAMALDRSGHWWPARVHPEDQSRMAVALEHLTREDAFADELRFRVKDGAYLWVASELRLLRDRSGAPLEVVGSWSDVSKRKQAEQQLRESEEQYRLLFDSNPHPMWVFERATLGFLAVNEAAIRHYGYCRDEFLAMTIRDIRPPEEIPALLLAVDHQASPSEVRTGVFKHRKKDGTVIDVEVSSTGLTFNERPARLILAVDITEKRNLQAQLLRAQKLESVGRLAGGVAHDFNNLLGVIIGSAELIQARHAGDPRLQRSLEDILGAGQRAAGLTRQLLAFSRKQILQPRVIDLNQVVAEVDKLLRRLIGEDITFTTDLAPELGMVKADPGQLEQVLMNLAVNSRDAMPQGGVLSISTRGVELDERYAATHLGVTAGRHVELAVSDTGEGMSPEVLGRIFEPFFTTKEAGKGTGLGLATVHGIIRQSGGHIAVASTPGQGSTFRLYLPVVDEATDEVPRALDLLPRGTETVLVVEDEALLRMIVLECLETLGYRVFEAENSARALELAAGYDGPIQLLLTDVVMPGGGGAELARQLTLARPELRVLFTSGFTDDAVLLHGLRAGVPFLEKPFTASSLARKVRDVLDG